MKIDGNQEFVEEEAQDETEAQASNGTTISSTESTITTGKLGYLSPEEDGLRLQTPWRITGYIGGAVAIGYKRAFPDYDFVALVRNEKSIPAVEAEGITVIRGSHSDLDLISEQASKADIVLNAADADDLALTKAILAGLKRTTIGKTPILIHTSGTGVVADEPTGNFNVNCKVYNDNEVEDIRSIPPTAFHRNVDLEIFEADTAGYVSAYIIAPSTVYGTGDGPVNRLSLQVPTLIRGALKHKQAVYVGDGTNEWNNVHIADLVDLYILVTQLAISELAPAAKVDSFHKFFWGSVGTHIWGDVARQIGVVLKQKGLAETDEAKSIPYSDEYLAVAINSRTIADRSRKIGWTPSRPPLDDTIPETVDLVVASS
ncbi:hypothetical protein FRC17_004700 [Serendipita sp. 399]|nr:hypothetical protein FRC17_004700 [Serendipita sp. 399]